MNIISKQQEKVYLVLIKYSCEIFFIIHCILSSYIIIEKSITNITIKGLIVFQNHGIMDVL